jgi:hypothetical protein
MDSYIERLPAPFLDKLFQGQWLPIVGAGMSATAMTIEGDRPPNWTQLGERFGDYLGPQRSSGPIDILSAYSYLYGRAGLVERLMEVLLIDTLEPSGAQNAFARLPFDMVVTTNVDFLLEAAYRNAHRQCVPLIGESQLSISRRAQVTYLLKFHGDLRHPEDLVMTEEDYDGFLRRRPLLATYVASWLLSREIVLIGYSLDDADFRDLLALLRERLGRLARPGWAIIPIDEGGKNAASFQRRGLNCIVLDPNPPKGLDQHQLNIHKGTVLERFFDELWDSWSTRVRDEMTASTDSLSAELQRA